MGHFFSPPAALLCQIHGLTSACLISVLPLPSHQEITKLLLPHRDAGLATTCLGCCSCSYTHSIPMTLFTRHHLCQGHQETRTGRRWLPGGGQGCLGKGTISASQTQHQRISRSWELRDSIKKLGSPMRNQTEASQPNSQQCKHAK